MPLGEQPSHVGAGRGVAVRPGQLLRQGPAARHGRQTAVRAAPATGLVPSSDLTGPAFDATRYWRGPAWFNTAWLVERGLRTHGRGARARSLREAVVAEAGRTGFAEYVDPLTGEGRGARQFSWTAALALDLLHTGDDPDATPAGHALDPVLTGCGLPLTDQEELSR
ncbi:hypothetical protein STREPTOSP366_62390 [Streptomyces variabilis]